LLPAFFWPHLEMLDNKPGLRCRPSFSAADEVLVILAYSLPRPALRQGALHYEPSPDWKALEPSQRSQLLSPPDPFVRKPLLERLIASRVGAAGAQAGPGPKPRPPACAAADVTLQSPPHTTSRRWLKPGYSATIRVRIHEAEYARDSPPTLVFAR
jgi:hypothetical protein